MLTLKLASFQFSPGAGDRNSSKELGLNPRLRKEDPKEIKLKNNTIVVPQYPAKVVVPNGASIPLRKVHKYPLIIIY